MRLLLIIGAAALIIAPAAAEVTFPISIPQECLEVAQREGVPAVIQNKYQAAKARLKLANLSNSETMVRECRQAVRRAVEAARYSR